MLWAYDVDSISGLLLAADLKWESSLRSAGSSVFLDIYCCQATSGDGLGDEKALQSR